MKNYVAPVSSVLSMNMKENIANSVSQQAYRIKWDNDSGWIINVTDLDHNDYSTFNALISWLVAQSQDVSVIYNCL